MKIKVRILLILLFFSPLFVFSQREVLRINGKVRAGKEKQEGVRVSLLLDGDEINQQVTGNNGRFLYKLPLQANYMVVFSKRGYRSKYINVIAENIPLQDAAFGF